ncbi:hypothetical protein A2716_05230 [candidate division WWE3 bacterium RIFCSPHIGHO2_01_FULL_40_23]|uniref:DUF4870 domain-containing protein n=1 Tax=candidate division WWE3 bacterium RIFCSPLOWO2_01_FULL_41_18 TaxID=1802625 RepID=A0A1F4VDC2_UNCKA|nr:MAG: hypothetical protein A2716_05230 [candidate division WWE3 bacterium RIFCSPHIGHO2_01_FULL_40_23]OGC55272.1 MAG: hypothetical protein A3A78_04840 [candidate division WWE3 bacterium RIFCSPLOWO2_01_FULL_41_18]
MADEKMASGQGSMEQNKVIAIVGYIIPLLFFIPLLTEAKSDPYAKFHANQQLLLLLFWVVGSVVSSVLSVIVIGLLLYVVVWVGGLVFMVMGIMTAAKGEMKPLPLIGNYTLLK